MSEKYDIEKNKLLIDDGEYTKIKKSDFRKFIDDLTETKNVCLNCERVDSVFNRKNNLIVKTAEDILYPAVNLQNDYINTHVLSDDDLRQLSKVVGAISKAVFAMRNLDELVRPSEDYKEIIRSSTDMRGLLEEYVGYVRTIMPEAAYGSVELKCNIKKSINARINPTEFVMVLSNLVINALTHSHAVKNRVEIILNHVKDKVAVSVLDYGRGVDLKKIHTVMKNKIDNLISGAYEPVKYKGCGLIVCQKLVGYMGGKILVANYPGAGAVFTILLDAPEETRNVFMLSDYVVPKVRFDKQWVFMAFKQLETYQ